MKQIRMSNEKNDELLHFNQEDSRDFIVPPNDYYNLLDATHNSGFSLSACPKHGCSRYCFCPDCRCQQVKLK